MPLIACPDCGREVSDAAPACIHCGRPDPAAPVEQEDDLETPALLDCPKCAKKVTPREKGQYTQCWNCRELIEHPGWVSAHRARQAPPASGEAQFSPGVAAVLSLVIPGAGQMYRGKVGAGFGWMIAVVLGYIAFVFPGLILHIICVFNAAGRGA